MELDYQIQNYEWGKKGASSKVATLQANANKNFEIDENTTYSELWIGTHVNGPSSLKNGKLLSSLINENPHILGKNVQKHFGNELPFLFKILSVNQALSIQAHPSKAHAERLHKDFPDIYKDPNHKPELAIALTPFEALCGFRPLKELTFFIQNIPELAELISPEILEKYFNGQTDDENLIKDAFRAVLSSSKLKIKENLQHLTKRLAKLDDLNRHNQLAWLVERLYRQYPDDVGCFVVYFLNYMKLQPGDAIYLAANVPHAYLYGDCVECMACSDNVVRAGLTPKLIDVETLCGMLIYKGQSAESNLFRPINEDAYTKLFKPPVPDFAVAQLHLPASLGSYTIANRSTASILLVIEGSGKIGDLILKPGTALFVAAEEVVNVTNIQADLVIYQGLANV